jgi:6-phosphogluconolactonase (cycloisomerase 2 family)
MNGAAGIAITPDGKNLYAAALQSASVVHMTLDGGGNPSFAGCIGLLSGCTATSPTGALNGVVGLAASPDGKHLYAASVTGSNVSHFTIRPTGGLDFAGCIGGLANCGPTSPDGALNGVFGVTLSPDGRQLYAAVRGIGIIGHYTRDVAGNLAVAGCIGNLDGCTATSPAGALSGVSAIAVTADGSRLYAAGEPSIDGWVSHLSLDSAGNPLFGSCIGTLVGCAVTTPAKALARATGVALGPDGRNLYVAALGADAIGHLAIEQASPPPPPRPPPPPPGGGTTPAFGSRTLVTLALATARIPGDGPLAVRIANGNGFAVSGRLSGKTIDRVAVALLRRISLKPKAFTAPANAKKTVKPKLPRPLRRVLKRTGRLRLRLTATVRDPAGNTRTVSRRLTPKLRVSR